MNDSDRLMVLLRYLFKIILGILLTASFVSLLIIIPALMRNCVCFSFEGLKNLSTYFEPVSNLYTLTATLLAIILALRQLDLTQNAMSETSKQLNISSKQLELSTKQLNTSIALSPENIRSNKFFSLLEESKSVNTHFGIILEKFFVSRVLPYLSSQKQIHDRTELRKALTDLFGDSIRFLEEGDLLYVRCGGDYPKANHSFSSKLAFLFFNFLVDSTQYDNGASFREDFYGEYSALIDRTGINNYNPSIYYKSKEDLISETKAKHPDLFKSEVFIECYVP